MKFEDFDLLSLGNTVQLVGAVYRDKNKGSFVALFPEDTDAWSDSIELLVMDRDQWKQFLRQSDIVETEVLAQASDGKLAKAIIRKTARNIESAINWAVFRRDEYACRYCGKNDVPLTVDHVVTWEDGGPSIEENLVSSCRKCNRVRGNTPYEEWLKDPFYLNASKGLSEEVKKANRDLVETLDAIPRRVHRRSR